MSIAEIRDVVFGNLPVRTRAERAAAAVVEYLSRFCRWYVEDGQPYALTSDDQLVLISPRNNKYRELIFRAGISPRVDPVIWERVLLALTEHAFSESAKRAGGATNVR